MSAIWILLILIIGGYLRFTGLDWDEKQHLHPDERFLTMVTTDIKWPDSFQDYFDPTKSPLSPYAQNPTVWYVYGTLPIYLTKWVGVMLDKDSYDKIYLVGRALSGIFDLACVVFIFLIGQRLYDHTVGLLGALCYALAVHPIQLSHFFAVDTFANFFVVVTFYWGICASQRGNWWFYLLMGITLGAGMASKMSVMTLGVVVLFAGFLDISRFYRSNKDIHGALEHIVLRWGTVVIVMLLVFRVLQPIAFQGPGFFNFGLFEKWQADIQQMKSIVEGDSDAPPFVQWTDRPNLLFPWQNIVLWGLGVPLGLAAWVGWLLGLYELLRYRKIAHLLPVIYIGAAFVYHGTRWVKYMRYFMPIYPFLALMAAYLLIWVWRYATEERDVTNHSPSAKKSVSLLPRQRSMLATVLTTLVIGGTLFYAVAFTAIYRNTCSRIAASRWIYAHVPKKSVLANEHWDDPLPLRIDGKDGFFDWYIGVSIKNYDPTRQETINDLIHNLTQSDYVILSSNRLYDSITRMPLRYPVATRYYQLLFAERLGFEKVAEFTSYPRLFGIEIPDQSADESFTVYDHPKVTIFKKTATLSNQVLRDLLTKDIDWYTYIHLTPKQATNAPTGLMFFEQDRMTYQESGTWSEIFDRNSVANHYPDIVWFLALEALALLAMPFTFVIFRLNYDRGYILAKPVGLLLVGWGTWMLASLRVVRFGKEPIVITIAGLALVSLWFAWLYHRDIATFFRQRWRFLVLEEAFFWGIFLLGLFIRWKNPDIVHAFFNDDKPMSFAHLNAVIKSPYFPPYDPWYAGGYINTPYFGYVLVAIIVHLTGIIPAIAYNLAVPTFLALTATTAFAVVFSLVASWQENRSYTQTPPAPTRIALFSGLLGMLFVSISGNLSLLRTLFGKLENFPSYQETIRVVSQDGTGQILNMLFPYVLFLQANLNSHMMVLPFVLLAIALASTIVRKDTNTQTPLPLTIGRIAKSESPLFFALALVVGVLPTLDVWAWPICVIIISAALFFRHNARTTDIVSVGWSVFWRMSIVLGLGYMLFWPFHRFFASPYTTIEPWKGTHIGLQSYLVMYALFLMIIVPFLIVEFFQPYRHNSLTRLLRLMVRQWKHILRLKHLHKLLVYPTIWYDIGLYLLFFIGAFVCILIIFQQWVVALSIMLLVLTLLLMHRRTTELIQQYTLFLIALGFGLILFAEHFVPTGFGNSMEQSNHAKTVLILSLHIWIVWGIAAASCLFHLMTRLQLPMGKPNVPKQSKESMVDPSQTQVTKQFMALVSRSSVLAWWFIFIVFFASSFHFPLFATLSSFGNRLKAEYGTTLNGMDFMNEATYTQEGASFELKWDLQAVEWLQDHVQGSPVIVEVSNPSGSWAARISTYTGLPVIVGWEFPEKEQRAVLPPSVVDVRKADVQTIYADPDPDVALALLNYHRVRYIYIGLLERGYYQDVGLKKFEAFAGKYWNLVYENPQAKIYEVILDNGIKLRNPPM